MENSLTGFELILIAQFITLKGLLHVLMVKGVN